MKGEYRLMAFDLVIGGHHGFYIQHLVEHWEQQDFQGHLDIVVLPEFCEKYPDIVQGAAKQSASVKFVPISQKEAANLKVSNSAWRRLMRSLQEWRLMCRYAKRLQASHILMMYFDTAWLPVSLGFRSPCSFSGIYFRPTLHYQTFTNPISVEDARLQQKREKLILTRWLKHPQLHTLFSLDVFSVDPIEQQIEQIGAQTKIVHLPDPIELLQPSIDAAASLKVQLNIESNRKVFLLFGALTSRKGIDQLLAAIQLLPEGLCQKICLVLLGEGDIDQLEPKVNAIRKEYPIQIVEQYQFIPAQTVRDYFEIADVVLAPYQKHVGMSGILLWAAAANKPVLSSDYGLMGELVRKWDLGVTIDSTSPKAIAQGLEYCLSQSLDMVGDRKKMAAFANNHSVNEFVRVLAQGLQPEQVKSKPFRSDIGEIVS